MTKRRTILEDRIDDLVFWTGRQMLYFAFFCFVISYLFWFLKINNLTHVAETSLFLLLCLNIGLWVQNRNRLRWRILAASLTLLFAIFVIGSSLLSHFYDTTYDGMRAHQASIVALKNGWNPITDPTFSEGIEWVELSEKGAGDTNEVRFVESIESLSKAKELQGSIIVGKGYKVNSFYCLCAVVFSRFNNLESAKSVHLFLLIAAIGITFRYLKSTNSKHPILLALLVSLNPVLLYQFSSFMLDGYTYSLFQLFFFSVLALFHCVQSKLLWLDAITSGILLLTSKISGASYFLAIMGAVVVLLFVRYFSRKSAYAKVRWLLMIVMLIMLSDGVIRSYQLRLLVVHDVSISSILDRMMQRDQSRPGLSGIPELAEQNKLQRYFWSNFSMTHINPHHYRLKKPGTIEREELSQIIDGHGEYRTGGFGPLYSAMLLLALALLLTHKNLIFRRSLILYAIVLFVVSWFSPVWWARWAAFQWMIPLFPLILLEHEKATPSLFSIKKGIQSPLGLYFLGVINVVLVASLYSVGRFQTSARIDNCVKSIDPKTERVELYYSTFPTNQFWFLSKSIEVRLVSLDEADLTNRVDLESLPGTSSRYRIISL